MTAYFKIFAFCSSSNICIDKKKILREPTKRLFVFHSFFFLNYSQCVHEEQASKYNIRSPDIFTTRFYSNETFDQNYDIIFLSYEQ
jgi:hypothetical protein